MSSKLTVTPFSTGGTAANLVDGDVATVCICPYAEVARLGLDAATAFIIKEFKFIPRNAVTEFRWNSVPIYGANNADFSDKVQIGTAPSSVGSYPNFTTVTITDTTPYRYVFAQPGAWVAFDGAELEVWGDAPASGPSIPVLMNLRRQFAA